MKLIALLLSFLSISAFSQESYRELPNNAFGFGERLSYEISYGFITAAESFITISPNAVPISGRETYEVNFEVNSRSSFDVIYKVRDNYKTFIDTRGIFPWRFEQHIREQNFKKDFEISFMPDSSKVITKTDYTNVRSFSAPAYVQDILSALYYVRTLDLSKYKGGDVITVETFNDDKHFPQQIRIEGRETIDVASGEFKTVIVQPMLQEGFTNKTSDIFVYLSDDERKIPVKVKMKIVIGALVAELTEYSGLRGPLDAKIGD
ncbi:MAG: DUF3108 domain-containing protein [Ignavibacteria bacterium]|nr:DUF3108 domain-containing protein [Ignavibacteria bacterium]MCC7159582.1 DUF3108 domain-containing protein [Ignavibacteria bacterium]